VAGRARYGLKPNGIKFIMFLKMSMFYIRGIIIRARQRNNLRDTIMKSRDYTRRTGGPCGVEGCKCFGRNSIGEGCEKKTNKSALLILYR